MAIITISRESGARGSYIGRKLAERLGYLYADRELIHEVSLEYGIRQDEFEPTAMESAKWASATASHWATACRAIFSAM